MSLQTKINVAKALTAQLHVTEEAIDTALSEAAHLVEAYISSRRAVRLAATAGGDVHENTLKAMLALHAAQAHMTAAHQGLTRVQGEIGLSKGAIIPPFDKPDDPNDPGNGGISNVERAPDRHLAAG
ncbi:MAG: hypothetical protein WDN06_01900 [Asticcacaulis sp.]